MSVRFVIGRAGAGKTHHCLREIQRALCENAIEGPRLILLVPEQASQQMERALLLPLPGSTFPPPPGAHRAEVLSFQRLAFRVLESVSAPSQQALTEPARAMVLRHLLARLSPQLKYYAHANRLTGACERLATTITELIQEAVDPAALLEATAPVSEVAGDAGGELYALKVHDLALIYRAYLEYLGTERVDPSQYLQLARERMSECDWLRGACVWADGFASFSGQELRTLTTLARLGGAMQVSVLADAPGIEQGSLFAVRGRDELFGKPVRTINELTKELSDAGVGIEEPVILDSAPPRFASCAELSLLEARLFAQDPPDVSKGKCEHIELVELPSRRLEAEYAVGTIMDWIARSKGAFRLRDAAIIVRDIEVYQDILREVLAARKIPFFMDQRRSVAHHPLVELLRGLLSIAAEDMSLDSVRVLLKTGFLPIEREAIDRLENYLIAHGISGYAVWNREWTFSQQDEFLAPKDGKSADRTKDFAAINGLRKRAIDSFSYWLTAATKPEPRNGDEWASLLLASLQQLDAARILSKWTNDAQGRGNLIEAEEHRQTWTEVFSFLDDLSFAFRGIAISVDELRDIVETGLSQLTLGLAPPTVDQLLVGSIERSRHPDLKAAVILGLNDGVFPKRHTEDSIFNDDDRAALRGRGLRIGPPARERIEDESMLFYVAATRPSQRLIMTYSLSDNDGRPLAATPFVKALEWALPGLKLQSVGHPIASRSLDGIQTLGDLRVRTALEFGTRPGLEKDDSADSYPHPTLSLRGRGVTDTAAANGGMPRTQVRARWNDLYAETRIRLSEDRLAHWAFGNLEPSKPCRLTSAAVERVHRGTLHTSVSRLETYAACPFQYFAKYVLSVREREQAEVAPVDVGKLHHAILEEFMGKLSNEPEGLTGISDQRLISDLQEACGRVRARMSVAGALSDSRERYRLRRSASLLGRILRAQRAAVQAGRFRSRAVELPFGMANRGGLPALTISTPKGRSVELRGFIDRVDLAELSDEVLGYVIDYKRTREKRLDLSSVYHGLSLQLLAYLLVLAEHGETLGGRPIRSVGAFYVSSSIGYKSVSSAEEVAGEDVFDTGTRLRGLISAGDATHLDGAIEAGKSSQYFSFGRNKDGAIRNLDASDGADGEAFKGVLVHVRKRMGELGDALLDGDIAVSPIRLGDYSPCSWCTMQDVCRFEMGASDVRFLDRLKRSEILVELSRSPRDAVMPAASGKRL